MKRRNPTKRALLLSALSLLLCVSMLVGSTFAWFTDSVTSANNIIKSGNLDVELEYAKVVNGQMSGWATVQDATEIFDPNALWEPGRVEVVYLKVSNLGTLALKYQLGVNVYSETPGISVKTNEEFKLSDHLVFKTVEMPDALTTYTDREAAALAAGTEKGLTDYNGTTKALDPKDGANDEDYVALIVYMPETVGNEANYKAGSAVPTITLGVNLYATQMTAEDDSFDDQYDKDAWHEEFQITTADDLQDALVNIKDGDVIKFASDITFTTESTGYNDGTYVDGIRYLGDKSFTIDLNGYTIIDDGCVNDYLLYLNNKGEKANEITIKNGSIVSKNGCWATVCVNSSVATQETVLNLENMNVINSNDATYSGNLAVRVRNMATVNVNKGTVITSDGASYGIAASTTGSIVNINDGATVIQQNSGVTGGNSVFAAVGGKGIININDGATITSDKYGVHTMTTGTPVVNVNGGTITADVALKASTNGGTGELSTINVTGGSINGKLETYTSNGHISVSGGTFSVNPSAYVADGYVATDNGDGTWSVGLPTASNAAELKDAMAQGGTVAIDGKITVEDVNNGVRNEVTIVGGTLSRDSGNGNPLTVYTTEPVTFTEVTFESVKGSAVLATRTDGANITLNDCVFKNLSSPSTGNTGVQVYAENVTFTFNNCTFNNMPIVTNSSYPKGIKLVFNNCTFSWIGANCPAMLQLANYVEAEVEFNDCTYTYDAPLTSTRINDFVATLTSTGTTTIKFNNFKMIGTAMEGKIWSVVSKGGVTSGLNVTVTATGINTYTFNGNTVDFATYLFK